MAEAVTDLGLVLRWHGSLSAKVNKNTNLGYSHDWG